MPVDLRIPMPKRAVDMPRNTKTCQNCLHLWLKRMFDEAWEQSARLAEERKCRDDRKVKAVKFEEETRVLTRQEVGLPGLNQQ